MADDIGVVVGVYGKKVRVKSHRNECCDHCEARDGCRVMGGGKDMFFEVENSLNAQMGDQVKVRVSDKAFLKAIFLVYVIPMIAFIGGAFWGNTLGEPLGMDPSATAALAAFGLMGVVFAVVRVIGNRLGQKAGYKPRMVCITARAGDVQEFAPASCPSE
ncbi:positive regulator of sigma E, RseC/MucC [Desulfatibacillum aliphaticivorans]|uniref:Positive regulator of sigma E, RseC/MucC n=1 Tax=Desulfatibacillum aliphaticivorans TaxID=218208 RepID=B8FIP7_DESAL|nr:SoxR reducing system RseC family protein [Desulfatibacillum aliphaticivorans]ACL04288.1 positive regulator of sigma E, RseC/MucC [Desulfatibacillum aliphaticivorans]